MADLRRLNARTLELALERAQEFVPFAPAADRGAWVEIGDRMGSVAMSALVERARAHAGEPIPALPASLYADFERTGRREPYEDAQRQRRNMLYRLVLAECLAWQGEFLDAISDLLWARLEETNWAWPAHARGLDAPDRPTLDLAAAMTALDLAEIDYLLAERLDARLRARLRHEVDRRAISAFLERHDHWWLNSTPERQVNNWTAVCVAGAAGAACYLETDRARLAEILARAMHALADYLETFNKDGGSSEGPAYWSYGFGNYVVFAHLAAARLGGAIDLLDDPFVRDIAQFPLRTLLGARQWVSFSDSDLTARFDQGLLTLLADRLDLPDLKRLGEANEFDIGPVNQFAMPLRQFLWPLPESQILFSGARHDWFDEMGWMIARTEPSDAASLRVAIKGGHNGEMHNQNDVGSFIVMADGEAVLTDPGRGRYSRSYFGPDRYECIMASSLGHSVPVVGGQPQAAGRDHAARVLDHQAGSDEDRLRLDMTAAYPADAGLHLLERELVLDRRPPGGAVRLTDRYVLKRAEPFESVLITTGSAEITDNEVTVRKGSAALRIGFDAAAVAVRLDIRRGVEKQHAPAVDITRVVFAPTGGALSGEIALQIRR